jgi:Flp pilus assembly protein TadD
LACGEADHRDAEALARARQRLAVGDATGAEQLLHRSVTFRPHDPAVLHLLGLAAFQQRRLDDARSLLQAALGAASDFMPAANVATIASDLGAVCAMLGDIDAA